MWLGIDFGTCFSSAALLKDGRPTPVQLGHNRTALPSSAYVDETGKIEVGQTAEYKRQRDPARFKREFKRDLGTTEPYLLGGRQLLPEQLIAEVLRTLKRTAEHHLLQGASLMSAVVTVPANYQQYKRQLMDEAGKAAGFVDPPVTLLEEPVAAALYHAWRQGAQQDLQDGDIVLVYDLGGGTFDPVLMEKGAAGYTFLALSGEGENWIGGSDFDRLISKDLLRCCSASFQNLMRSRDETGLLLRLQVEEGCRDIKHELSETDEAMRSFPCPPQVPERYSLTRDTFKTLIAPLVEQTLVVCRSLLNRAGLRTEQVTRVLLVGGSCRIPYVQQAVSQAFQRPVVLVDEPELAVCLGAALYGATLSSGQRSSKPSENRPRRPYTVHDDPWDAFTR